MSATHGDSGAITMVLLLPQLALLLVLPQTSLGFVMVAPFSSRMSCLFGSKEEDLFAQYCDPDGFMTKESLAKVPEIAEMLVRSYPSPPCRIVEKLVEVFFSMMIWSPMMISNTL